MKIFSAQLKGTTTVATGANVSLTGSFSGSIAGIDINSTNTFTASLVGTNTFTASLVGTNTFTASLIDTNTFTSSTSARLNSIETISASNIARINSLETTSASVDSLNTTQNTRLNSLENKTGSLATTGSNTFIGTQVITGSVYISQNLIVQGSSSLQNITASAVDIGTNKIILNVDNPAIRYAGISVYDSGSTNGTGSLFWDSVNNYWLYEHPEDSGAPYNSAILISGPKNAGALGEESGLVTNYITKAVGGDHISSSAIYDDGAIIKLLSNTEVTSSLKVSGSISIGTSGVTGSMTIQSKVLNSSGSVLNVKTSYTNKNSIIELAELGSDGAIILKHALTTSPTVLITSQTGGTSPSYFNNGSNVGIGLTNPNYKLEVNGSGKFSSQLNVNTLLNILKTDDSTIGAQLAYDSNANQLYLWNSVSNGYFSIYTNNTDRLNIASGGNIGIGTTNATRKVDIISTGEQLRLAYNNGGTVYTDFRNDSAGGLLINTSGGYIINYIGGSEKMRITSDGYVGIGTTNPSGKLHVMVAETQSQTTGFKVVGDTNGKSVILGANTSYSWIQAHGSAPLYINELGNNVVLNLGGGNTSVGSTTAYGRLHITGPTITSSAETTYGLWVSDAGTSEKAVIVGYNSGLDVGQIQSVHRGQAWKNLSMLTHGGNLGVGTASPGARLEVKASGDGDLIIGRYSGGSAKLFYVYQSSADGYLELRTGADATVTKLSGYTGTQSYMNTKLTVGGTSSYNAATLNVEGIIRANRSMYAWYQGGTNSWDGYQYLHLKTNLYGGAAGNSMPTMSLFSARMYSYSSNYVREGNMGFHNWSGTIYNLSTNGTIWSGAYMASDGNVVLVLAIGGGSYMGVTVDYHQAFGYPFQDRWVTAASPSNSTSGVY